MNFSEYQKHALATANDSSTITNWALGLCGEAGEVADIIKKAVFHGHPLDKDALSKELGDALWYIAVLADGIGFDLNAIASDNIAKLQGRYPNGFSEDSSRNRKEPK